MKIGDIVKQKKSGVKYKILNQLSTNMEDPVYELINEDGEISVIRESLLEISHTFDDSRIKADMETSYIINSSKMAVKSIIEELNLRKVTTINETIDTIIKIYNYLINLKNGQLENKKQYSDNFLYEQLHNSLVKKQKNHISSTLTMNYILKKLNIEVLNIVINNNGKPHMLNLVEIGDLYYYFDSTDELIKGMGKNEYSNYYQDGIVVDNKIKNVGKLPKNISLKSLPNELINREQKERLPKKSK